MRNICVFLLCWLAPCAMAEDAAAPAAVTAALARLAPGAPVDGLRKAALPGFHEAAVGGQPVMVSDDGHFLLAGALWDLRAQRNLSEPLLADVRRDVLATLPAERRFVFAAERPRATVTVFTAIDCGYCRRLHEQMAEINAAGISVEYLLLPRGGADSPSHATAVSAWCAADRADALTAAKRGHAPPHKVCPNPIDEHAALARRLGVANTPTLVAADGRVLGGYLAPAQLVSALGLGAPPAR
jgi:thiol:disulfide interchange protein DsbC